MLSTPPRMKGMSEPSAETFAKRSILIKDQTNITQIKESQSPLSKRILNCMENAKSALKSPINIIKLKHDNHPQQLLILFLW